MVSDGQTGVVEKEAWFTPKAAGGDLTWAHLRCKNLPRASGGAQPCLPGALHSLGRAQPVIPATLGSDFPSFSLSLASGSLLAVPGSHPSTETNLCKGS